MKKIFVVLIAVCSLVLVSCSYNSGSNLSSSPKSNEKYDALVLVRHHSLPVEFGNYNGAGIPISGGRGRDVELYFDVDFYKPEGMTEEENRLYEDRVSLFEEVLERGHMKTEIVYESDEQKYNLKNGDVLTLISQFKKPEDYHFDYEASNRLGKGDILVEDKGDYVEISSALYVNGLEELMISSVDDKWFEEEVAFHDGENLSVAEEIILDPVEGYRPAPVYGYSYDWLDGEESMTVYVQSRFKGNGQSSSASTEKGTPYSESDLQEAKDIVLDRERRDFELYIELSKFDVVLNSK